MNPPTQPTPPLTVTALTRQLKRLIEGAVRTAVVVGEVSNLRQQPSGHCYFTLKDASSQLPCVLFRAEALRLLEPLKNGQQVIVSGHLSVYEPRGAYQLVARSVQQAGAGGLHAKLEALKHKLRSEGLFDAGRKKPLPEWPRRVGFITSASGAVWRDVVSILKRSGWCGDLLLVPAQVQGPQATKELVAGLQRACKPALVLDLVIIGRGGGSLEDLWCFNEEALVRAVAACPLPIISAVGHETDTTLCDYAADVRAETPSAAADLLAATWQKKRLGYEALQNRLETATQGLLSQWRAQLELYGQRMTGRVRELMHLMTLQRLDELEARLHAARAHALGHMETRIEAATLTLSHQPPHAHITRHQGSVDQLQQRLMRSKRAAVDGLQNALDQLEQRSEASGLPAILRRGFSTVQATDGQFICNAAEAKSHKCLKITFSDGTVEAQVLGHFDEPR